MKWMTKAPVDADPLSPDRAVAAAFPAVGYGSASTVQGISGLVPFSPAYVADFGPPDSCLRFAQAVTGLDARLGPSNGVARPIAGGTCRPPIGEQVTHWKAPTWPGAHNVPEQRRRGAERPSFASTRHGRSPYTAIGLASDGSFPITTAQDRTSHRVTSPLVT